MGEVKEQEASFPANTHPAMNWGVRGIWGFTGGGSST